MMLLLKKGGAIDAINPSILAFILSAKPAHTSRGPFRQREFLRKPKPRTRHIKIPIEGHHGLWWLRLLPPP